jgi:hypothetical protein
MLENMQTTRESLTGYWRRDDPCPHVAAQDNYGEQLRTHRWLDSPAMATVAR